MVQKWNSILTTVYSIYSRGKCYIFQQKRSEILSNNRIHEHDGYSSSDEEINDKDSTQQNEEANQQNSIDGTVEESQA